MRIVMTEVSFVSGVEADCKDVMADWEDRVKDWEDRSKDCKDSVKDCNDRGKDCKEFLKQGFGALRWWFLEDC